MNSGTAPNTSIVLTETEIDYINRRFGGRKSAAIHQALEDMMVRLPFPFDVDWDDLIPLLSPYNQQWSETVELWIDGEKRKAGIEIRVPGQGSIGTREYYGMYAYAEFGFADDEGVNVPTPKALNAYLNSAEAQTLLSRVCDGLETYWDGHNMRGRFSDDANDAVAALEEAIGDLPHESIAVWQADDWFQQTSPEQCGVTAKTTDEQIAGIAKRFELDAWDDGGFANHAIVHGIADLLIGWRDELRNEAEDDGN